VKSESNSVFFTEISHGAVYKAVGFKAEELGWIVAKTHL